MELFSFEIEGITQESLDEFKGLAEELGLNYSFDKYRG
jgi:hypothetical protein